MISEKGNRLVWPLSVLLLVGICSCGRKTNAPGNSLVNRIDKDKDGYCGSFDLRIDANGQIESDTLQVKTRVISPETMDTIWTDVWTVKGKAPDDAHTVHFKAEDFHLKGPCKINLKVELYDSAGINIFDTDNALHILVDDNDAQPHIAVLFADRSPAIINPLDRDKDRFVESFELRIDANTSAEKATRYVKARIISRTTGDTLWTDPWKVKGTSSKDAVTRKLKVDQWALDSPKQVALEVALYDTAGEVLLAVDSSLTVQADYDTSSLLKAAFRREARPGGPPELPPVPVEVARAVRGPASSFLVATATLESERRADVVAKVEGLVAQLYVEEGTWVREGDILAQLDDERLKIQVDQALTDLSRLEADYQRAVSLFEKKLISQEQHDNIRFQHESQKSVCDLRKLDLKYSSITAPISGVVTERLIRIGNQVNPNQKVFAIASFNPLVARVFVPESEMGRLKTGQAVRILIDADGGEIHEGRVTRISPVVDPASGTVKATIEITGSSHDKLKPGMFARLKIITDTRNEALVVPKRALVSDDGKQTLFVVENGLARKKEVSVGYEDEGQVEILSGIKEGDDVVTIGQSGLSDSARVELIQ